MKRFYVSYEETQLRQAFVEAKNETECQKKLARRMDGIEYLPEVTIGALRVTECSEIGDDVHESDTTSSPPDTLERASVKELLEELGRRARVFVALGDGFPGRSGMDVVTQGSALEVLGAVEVLSDTAHGMALSSMRAEKS